MEEKQKLIYQLFIGKVCDELGDEKTFSLLMDSKKIIDDLYSKTTSSTSQ